MYYKYDLGRFYILKGNKFWDFYVNYNFIKKKINGYILKFFISPFLLFDKLFLMIYEMSFLIFVILVITFKIY